MHVTQIPAPAYTSYKSGAGCSRWKCFPLELKSCVCRETLSRYLKRHNVDCLMALSYIEIFNMKTTGLLKLLPQKSERGPFKGGI